MGFCTTRLVEQRLVCRLIIKKDERTTHSSKARTSGDVLNGRGVGTCADQRAGYATPSDAVLDAHYDHYLDRALLS